MKYFYVKKTTPGSNRQFYVDENDLIELIKLNEKENYDITEVDLNTLNIDTEDGISVRLWLGLCLRLDNEHITRYYYATVDDALTTFRKDFDRYQSEWLSD
jgi:hypothetical protein